jgi:hypothetical protein
MSTIWCEVTDGHSGSARREHEDALRGRRIVVHLIVWRLQEEARVLPGGDDAGCRHSCTEQRRREAIALDVLNQCLENIVVRDRADTLPVGDRAASPP